MTKGELKQLVDMMPNISDDEEVQDLEALVEEAIDLQYLLLMRAVFRMRSSMERRRRGQREFEEEDLR